MKCTYGLYWVDCPNEAQDGSSFCSAHTNKKCSSCGKEAIKDCGETMGALVCGAPLCKDCEHTLYSNGCNSPGYDGGTLPEGYGTHCRKEDQKYLPWYHPEYKKE